MLQESEDHPTAWARRADRVEQALLSAVWALTGAAVAGFATFGQQPALLARLPRVLGGFYGVAFGFFAQAQVWVAAVALAVVLVRRVGGAWVPAFLLVYVASLGSELAGTTWGVPFGAYAYGPLLGVMWLERVPVIIPLSWFAMALPSYALARALHPRTVVARVAVGSVVLLTWDLALDPAMSAATRYWVWGEAGPYYGMPWQNLFGWYTTGVVLMALLAWRDDGWVGRVPLVWMAGFYTANLALAVGMCAAAGLWGAVAAVAVLAGAGVAWLRFPPRAQPRGSGVAGERARPASEPGT